MCIMRGMKSWLEIDENRLKHNLETFGRITGKPVMFAVKANGYGHGLKEVVEVASAIPEVSWYAVDSVEEALEVKAVDPHKRILVIGWTDDEGIEQLLKEEIEMVAPSKEFISRAVRIAGESERDIKVHLKLETGTSRLGIREDELDEVLAAIQGSGVEVTGIYSHFANIEDTTDHTYAMLQLERFNRMSDKFPADVLRHFSCSAASLLFAETGFDLVRVGISAYGYWPSAETRVSYKEKNSEMLELKPVLKWCSRVAQVKDIRTGEGVGYGLTFQAYHDTRIAVIPTGYYDGYSRALSNVAYVLIRGTRAPVRGRICMNMFMVDVTHIENVAEGDEVVLLGSQGSDTITADTLGGLTGTISYEVLATINPLLPKRRV